MELQNEVSNRSIYRNNCMSFSKRHGIQALKESSLDKCKHVKQPLCVALTSGCFRVKPLLHYTNSYQETADRIGTFHFVCDENIPIAVLFVYCDGETFLSYDVEIADDLEAAGYRCKDFGVRRQKISTV